MTYLFYGDNTQERDAAVKQLLAAFVAVNGDMAVDVIDAELTDIDGIIDAITTLPFLAPKRLVVLRYLSSNQDIALKVDKIFDRVADSTDVLFIEARLDSRSVFTKTLKKRVSEEKRFESIEGPQLPDWLVKQATMLGGALSRQNAQLLIDRVGHNQQLLHNEITKLLLISTTISKEIITDMTHIAPSSSVFAMLDSCMKGDIRAASLLYYEQRIQGIEPQAILGMIAWQLHILATVVVADNESADVIAKKAKLNPFVVRKNLAVARRINKQKMVNLLDVAIKADMSIKTGKAKPDSAVHVLLFDLAQTINAAV